MHSIFGNVTNIERRPMKTTGFSGSSHERIVLTIDSSKTISLVLKHVHSSTDMTVWRSGNISDREARLINSDELKEVWNIIESPYIAYANEGDYTVLLMHDLSPYLFPDVREPLKVEHENVMLETLASVHSHFWNQELTSASWLTNEKNFFDFLGTESANEEKLVGRTHAIFTPVQAGWHLAFQQMPPHLRSFVLNPPVETMVRGLPKTLIHGDCKLANFALLPQGKVSAFDWTVVGHANSSIELGWYVAVNSSRLAQPKEKVFAKYREYFQQKSGLTIPQAEWQQMIYVAVLTGARMLLWNKALNVQKAVAGAREEWEWWIKELADCRVNYH